MIILLTLAISLFTIINIIAIACVIDDFDFIVPDKLINISRNFLIIEGILLLTIIVVLISYLLSHLIVCNTTNNDYKECVVEEVKEEE